MHFNSPLSWQILSRASTDTAPMQALLSWSHLGLCGEYCLSLPCLKCNVLPTSSIPLHSLHCCQGRCTTSFLDKPRQQLQVGGERAAQLKNVSNCLFEEASQRQQQLVRLPRPAYAYSSVCYFGSSAPAAPVVHLVRRLPNGLPQRPAVIHL